nr:DUF916 domain-containing protein [Halalkalibacter alkaliphilus]
MDSPFVIEPILPDNQIEGVSGYYHIQVKPGEDQTIYARIKNKRDHNITVHILPINSYTAPTGGILYEESLELDDTKILDGSIIMSELLLVDPFIELNANESLEVPIHIAVPETDKGTFLGGLLFASIGEDTLEEINSHEEGDIGFIIRNEITYTLAVQLDLPNISAPNFSIDNVGINVRPSGPELFMELTNDAQMILRGTHGNYRVENNSGEELFKGEIESFTMVPKTAIRYPVTWDYATFEPGVYNVLITANVLGEDIIAERTFEIEGEQINEFEEIREDAPEPVPISIPWWVWAIGGIIIAGFFYWLGTRRK